MSDNINSLFTRNKLPNTIGSKDDETVTGIDHTSDDLGNSTDTNRCRNLITERAGHGKTGHVLVTQPHAGGTDEGTSMRAARLDATATLENALHLLSTLGFVVVGKGHGAELGVGGDSNAALLAFGISVRDFCTEDAARITCVGTVNGVSVNVHSNTCRTTICGVNAAAGAAESLIGCCESGGESADDYGRVSGIHVLLTEHSLREIGGNELRNVVTMLSVAIENSEEGLILGTTKRGDFTSTVLVSLGRVERNVTDFG